MENIKYLHLKNIFLCEISSYKSIVDYKNEFNLLDDSIKKDLYDESLLLYQYFENEFHDGNINCNVIIDCMKKINDLPIETDIFATKIALRNNDIIYKIGFSVYNSTKVIQNVLLLNVNFTTKNEFINNIFNLLFYLHIFVRDFRYDSILKYF